MAAECQRHFPRERPTQSLLEKITTLEAHTYADHVHYSTNWPPNPDDIKAVAAWTSDLVMFAKSMRVLGIEFDDRLNPPSVHWLPEEQRRYYFSLYDRISQHVSWIFETTESPGVYKALFDRAYRVMNVICHMKATLTPLCYTGMDPARDSFEFYLRLVSHFGCAAHVIDSKQWKLKIDIDPFPLLIQQAESLLTWLEKRWASKESGMCAKDWQVYTCNDVTCELPMQGELFRPYDHTKAILFDAKTGRIYTTR